jgi:tRNA nucleotidyltransferase/poly(A) polymerase
MSEPYKMEASIPMPSSIYLLARIFRANGHQLYAVGGAVRDYLQQSNGEYDPKDVDVCTDAEPQRVGEILSAARIRNFPKGEAFGVWVAHIDGEDFEIATFREDMASSDGRRPDEVKFVGIAEDYKRRDMTMNALYYDIPEQDNKVGSILDFANYQGIADALDGRVRIIGNPMDRFGEDRLRILRVPRFHSQHCLDLPSSVIDDRTLAAMSYYGDLRNPVPRHDDCRMLPPVSGERIQQEFLKGVQKAKSVWAYLEAYHELGLFESVFPDLVVEFRSTASMIKEKHPNQPEYIRDPVVLLAVLLNGNSMPSFVRQKLNSYNWPNEITDEVEFLLNAYKLLSNPSTPLERLVALANKIELKPGRRKLATGFFFTMGHTYDPHWDHFWAHDPLRVDGEKLMQEFGISGPEVGKKKLEMQVAHYQQSLERFSFGYSEAAYEGHP